MRAVAPRRAAPSAPPSIRTHTIVRLVAPTLRLRAISTAEAAKQTLKAGMKGEYKTKVEKQHTTNRRKKPGFDILSSPTMILWMEWAAVNACEPVLPKGFATVGYHVDVKHLAPTPLGKDVVTKAELLEIQDKKLTFKVDAFEGEKLIGSGLHRRAVISTED